MNKGRLLKLTSLLLIPFLLTGCWDSVELNERHVVLELALDKNKKVDSALPIREKKAYKVTYCVPDMQKLSGEDSLSENVKTNITTESVSMATSIDEIETKTQNTVSFSNTKALIVGEEFIKDKKLFKGALEALLRDMSMSRSTLLLATYGEAGELTKGENPQNPLIGMYVMKYFNNRERPTSYAKGQMLGNIVKELNDTGITTLPIITKNVEDTLQIKGAALIKDYSLVDYLDQEVVRGQLFVEGKIKGVPLVIDFKGIPLTYIIKNEKSKISFDSLTSRNEGLIRIHTIGDITEYLPRANEGPLTPNDLQVVKGLLEAEIQKQVLETIRVSKALNVDFLNIGLEMYRKKPQLWKEYNALWEKEGYKDFPLRVEVNATIQNTGAIQ